MKLIHYTFRNLSVPLFLILTLWACCFYVVILHEIDDETNDSLENYKEIIIRTVVADTALLHDHVDIMTKYYIREVPPSEARLDKDEFFDSTVYIDIEMENEPVRVLRTWFKASNQKYYELTIKTSTLEKEDLVEAILWSIVLLYFALLCCILFVTHQAFRKSFQPLYAIIAWLKEYRPGKPQSPLINDTVVEEFKILNQAVTESGRRSTEIYNQQKQFVENAAHELQTPLAICLNKLELVSENPDCTEEQLKEISELHHTLNGIIKVNKSLFLLSRIENGQFPETTDVNWNELVKRILSDFTEMYKYKQLSVSFHETPKPIRVSLNESLAITLIVNLLKNAFVHTAPKGEIRIEVEGLNFLLANSGTKELDPTLLFKRFRRQTERKDSTGLGLAIVKSITRLYGIEITYRYIDGFHEFNLTFGKL